MRSAGSAAILWPPCHRDTQGVVWGLGHHRSWVKTLILCAAKLGRRAWLYDYSNSAFALLSPTGERRMQICQLWSRLSGLPRASGVCGHFAPFHYTTGENQAYCMCAAKVLTHTAHTSDMWSSWLCSKSCPVAPSSESQGAGDTSPLAPRPSRSPGTSRSPWRGRQGQNNPLPLCPSRTALPLHVRQPKGMRSHKPCRASAGSLVSGTAQIHPAGVCASGAHHSS